MKAYELFCLRGCDHGTEVEDWVSAKRDLSSESDDVAIEKSDAGEDYRPSLGMPGTAHRTNLPKRVQVLCS
jgi:hypothetical protein